MKFDPQTGEPIVEVTQPVTEQVSNVVKKSFFKRPLFFCIAGTVALAATAAALLFTGVLLGGRDKVAQAVVNTFKDSGELGKAIQTFKPEDMKEFTLAAATEVEGVELEVEYRHTSADKQVWVAVEQPVQAEATATITKGKVLASTPLLNDTLLVYDYTKIPTGYLSDMAGYNQSIFPMLNSYLSFIYSVGSEDVELSDEAKKEIKKWYKSIELEKEDDKESFEINGRDKDCVGYTLVIDEDFIEDFFNLCLILNEEVHVYDQNHLEDMFEGALNEIDGMDEINVTFYLDSRKLAGIILECEGEEVTIAFEGGKYRMQNINVEYEGITVAKIKGETDGKEESIKLVIDGTTVFRYTYNAKNGEFEAIVYEYGEEAVCFECTLKVTKDSITLEDASLEVKEYSYDSSVPVTGIDFDLSLKCGATIETLHGEEFNLSTADMYEFQELFEQLEGLYQ